jgi:hypothetical protein
LYLWRLKPSRAAADRTVVSKDSSPLPYLNALERKLLGPLVTRLFATGNPRFRRALDSSGVEATARMACVNALRTYAVVLFVLGTAGRIAGVDALGDIFYVLAIAAMAWSFWCLYTVVGPEREFKRRGPADRGLA